MQKKKIAGYIRAKRLMDSGKTQTEACKTAGISRMTFNKYKDLFGDVIPNTEDKIEVLPKQSTIDLIEGKGKNKELSELERIQKENAALQEQLKLRQELAKYAH